MEIRALHLTAFGPFTERTLVFNQEGGGFHIVYGPNEAGKSSALRGLKALLYSIDERTTDDFIHAKDKLLIKGWVRAVTGDELVFARRKGRKNTLLSPAGEPLDDNALAPFLQGVSRELFEMLFGIDHDALVQGGKEILEQKGEVGQALFSASLGSHRLHAVLRELEEEADRLFRPQGKNPTLNLALKDYADLSKQIREHSLSSRQWEEHRRAFERTAKELTQVQSELAAARAEVNRLQRIRSILPKLARRQELHQKLETLGEVTVLADDFGERRRKAIQERDKARAVIQNTQARLAGYQSQLAELIIQPEVLEHSESIEDLHARWGSHRKAMQDRPGLEAQYQQLLTAVESLLKEVRPDLALAAMETLRPAFAKRRLITELAREQSGLESQLERAESRLRHTEVRLAEVGQERRNMPEPGSPDTLRYAVVAARKAGDLDSQIQSTQRQLEALYSQCAADLARLTLWHGSLEAVLTLPVPSRESLHRFEEQYAELAQYARHRREKQEAAEEAWQRASQRLEAMRRAGDVPKEEDLSAVRNERQRAWKLLCRQWLGGEEVRAEAAALDGERTLFEAFEYRVRQADDLADRLRREAERVHQQASLLAELESEKRRAELAARQLEEGRAEKNRLDTEWEALWKSCQIEPLTPREMGVWLDKLEKLRDRVAELDAWKRRLGALEHSRNGHLQELGRRLRDLEKNAPATSSLEVILLESEAVVAHLEGSFRERERLDREIKERERDRQAVVAEHQGARRALETWQATWRRTVEDFGLDGEISPSEVDAIIDKLQQMFTKQKEAETLNARIQAIDKEAKAFHDQVGRTVARLAPELAGQSTDDAVMHLNTLLSRNRDRQSRRQELEKQQRQAAQDMQDSKAAVRTMIDRLEALCAEAKRDNPAELEEAEHQSSEYRRLQAEIDRIDQEVLSAGEGATLKELEEEARTVDPDALPGRLEALSHRIEVELEPKKTALIEDKVRQKTELERMDGSDRAAALAEQSQTVLADIRAKAEHYVRLKLAAKLLHDEIERYRQENQGPLIRRASEYFAALTRGSFAELRTDFNEKDEPILVGLRANQAQVPVEGMSSGTRDQLYLALRLASLEKYMKDAEPMPFVVDDILVDFDDERCRAALKALAALAEKTQVILFTHHSRVVEQAERLPASVQVHEL